MHTLLSLLFEIKTAFAAGPGPGGGTVTNTSVSLENPLGEGSTLISTINNIIDYVITVAVPILSLLIIYAGFQILTARDNPGQAAKGRQTILWASIGFAVILISKGVAEIVEKILTG